MSQDSKNNQNSQKPSKVVCPDCGSVMYPEGGCWICPECGYSPCK